MQLFLESKYSARKELHDFVLKISQVYFSLRQVKLLRTISFVYTCYILLLTEVVICFSLTQKESFVKKGLVFFISSPRSVPEKYII